MNEISIYIKDNYDETNKELFGFLTEKIGSIVKNNYRIKLIKVNKNNNDEIKRLKINKVPTLVFKDLTIVGDDITNYINNLITPKPIYNNSTQNIEKRTAESFYNDLLDPKANVDEDNGEEERKKRMELGKKKYKEIHSTYKPGNDFINKTKKMAPKTTKATMDDMNRNMYELDNFDNDNDMNIVDDYKNRALMDLRN